MKIERKNHTSLHNEVKSIHTRLLQFIKAEKYQGYDPYDALNSKLFNASGLSQFAWSRLCWIQLFKRSPINLRRLFLVPKQENPKAIALMVLGLMEDYKRTSKDTPLKSARELASWLIKNCCDKRKWHYYCWGYNFDWQARAFFVPKGTPNVITTCYVVRALLAVYEQDNDSSYLKAANSAASFINEVLYTESNSRRYYAYIPGEKVLVHNASLWGAAIVAHVGDLTNNINLKNRALIVCEQSIGEQREDGAWVYGERNHHSFIDGFHTGYNLEALDIARKHLQTSLFDNAIERGLEYYRSSFFLEDGTAKYYEKVAYPIDMHSVSQAIITLMVVGKTESDKALTEKVISRAIKTLYITQKGIFRYQINRIFKNNICYMRWTQAWAYYSLAVFLNHSSLD